MELFSRRLTDLVKKLPLEAHSVKCDVTPHDEVASWRAIVTHAAGLLFEGQLVLGLPADETPTSTSPQSTARSSGGEGAQSDDRPPHAAQAPTPPAETSHTANREIVIRTTNPLRHCQTSQSCTVSGPNVWQNASSVPVQLPPRPMPSPWRKRTPRLWATPSVLSSRVVEIE